MPPSQSRRVERRAKRSQISVFFCVMPLPIAQPSKVRASLAIASPTRIIALLASWMLTGARCGHHAKVTLDTFQFMSKEATPPQDPHGLQHARRLATQQTLQRTLTRPFGYSRCQTMNASLGFPRTAVCTLAPLGGKVAS